MRNIFSKLLLQAAVPVLLLAGAARAEGEKSVAVLSIVEHPALDAIRDGVQEGLQQAGFAAGKNLKWQYQSAQGNVGTAAQIARKFVGDRPDVIVAIATPAAQAVVAATRDVAVVFSGVTDPVEARLVPGWEASGTNVTGVSDLLPLEPQIALIRKIVPDARRVGVVYNPGEVNSVTVLKQLQVALEPLGMQVVEAAAPRSVDVSSAARSLVGKVDVIYTSLDNNVVSSYEALVKVGQEAKIPLVAADTDSVKRGAVAALGLNYRALGVQTGKMVVRILNGEAPGSIAPETMPDTELYINPGAAQRQGVTLSEDLVKSAAQVVE